MNFLLGGILQTMLIGALVGGLVGGGVYLLIALLGKNKK